VKHDPAALEIIEGAGPAPVREALEAHLALVLEASEGMNLTSVREPAEAWRLHVIDSLMVAGLVNAAPPGELADLGSGAGFPGIPLALVCERPLVLVESRKKRARFLAQALCELPVNGRVLNARAEESTEEVDAAVCVARAVAPLAVLVELAAPLLERGGHLIAMKGDPDAEEREAGVRAGEMVGMHERAVEKYLLPGGGEARSAFVYERIGESSVRLPRRPGMASKRPLA
jgi:16S rRNA (guanine527-N7)-methyltransferase